MSDFRIFSSGGSTRGVHLYFGEEDLSNRCTNIEISFTPGEAIVAKISLLLSSSEIEVLKENCTLAYLSGEDYESVPQMILEYIQEVALKKGVKPPCTRIY